MSYIQIYLYTWSMPKSFIKERFWILPFVIQRGILKICRLLCSVYMYIQSMRKDCIRSVLWSFTQEDPVSGYMDHNAHGSVIYTYRICTYHVLRLSRKITFYQPHKLIYLVSIGFTFITRPF